MGYSGAVSASLDDERRRQTRHRDLVERRAADLPTDLPASDGSTHRSTLRRLRRAAGPAARRARSVASRVGRPASRFLLAARAAPGARHREADRRALVEQLGRLPPAPPTLRSIACVVFGESGSLAEAAARSAGVPVTSVTPRGQLPPVDAELVCLLHADTEPLGSDWLARLAAGVESDVVAAAPVLLQPLRPRSRATSRDGFVRSSGLDAAIDADGAPIVRAREAGRRARPEDRIDHVLAVLGACVVIDRHALERAGGWKPASDVDAAMIDLCLRLRARGGRIAVVHNTFAVDHRPLADARRPDRPVNVEGAGWRAFVDQRGPTLWRQATRRPRDDTNLQFAITIAAPSEKMAPRWGDWHLASALARSLERLGHVVRVQTIDRSDDPAGRACDVHVVLHGLAPVRRTPGQRHVVWVISHPERIDLGECDAADLVLVASERFAADLRSRTTTPVEVMLQATDSHRFRPMTPVPKHEHPITVVAKTRDVPRPIVMDAIAAGLRPAIYGTGWESFVDPSLVVASYVPNAELPVVYSSAGVLLADHWEEMRAWGFVSNRVFDALACGTPTIADALPEIADLFGDAVTTYREPDDLRASVEALLGDRTAARARAREGQALVLEAHTFDHRASTLVALLGQYGLVGGDV
jgi:glycosyltransferase involved in cell wall biosynthesis